MLSRCPLAPLDSWILVFREAALAADFITPTLSWPPQIWLQFIKKLWKILKNRLSTGISIGGLLFWSILADVSAAPCPAAPPECSPPLVPHHLAFAAWLTSLEMCQNFAISCYVYMATSCIYLYIYILIYLLYILFVLFTYVFIIC